MDVKPHVSSLRACAALRRMPYTECLLPALCQGEPQDRWFRYSLTLPGLDQKWSRSDYKMTPTQASPAEARSNMIKIYLFRSNLITVRANRAKPFQTRHELAQTRLPLPPHPPNPPPPQKKKERRIRSKTGRNAQSAIFQSSAACNKQVKNLSELFR